MRRGVHPRCAAALTPDAVQNAFVAVTPGEYRLEAPLTFASAAALRDCGLALIEHAPPAKSVGAAARGSHVPTELSFDLEAVRQVDSAGLALLIDWLACARARGCRLRYLRPPETLQSLAQLSEVAPLIIAAG